MSTTCYAMIRGSAIRVTGLSARGSIGDTTTYAASKAVAKLTINEIIEGGSNELLRTPEDVPRLHFVRHDQTVRYSVDANFQRVDPGLLNLMIDTPLVTNYSNDIVGFDGNTRVKAKSFGLEVWSKIAQANCVAGQRQWGYTLFPFLRGGVLSDFAFANGLVSFNVKGAMTRRNPGWAVGPYDISGPYQRLDRPVSGNTSWRTIITTLSPPAQTNGTVTVSDVIEGGSASSTTADVVDGQFVATSTWIIDGGSAA